MSDVIVAKVNHYYDKIGVAVIELIDNVKVGETLRFSGHGNEFTQIIDSMQVEHKEIEQAKKGEMIGLKVSQSVKEGDEVYKVVA